MFIHQAHQNDLYSILSNHRSGLEIDQALCITLQKIRANVKERLGWFKAIFPISRKVITSIAREPCTTIFKTTFCVGSGYVIYLLTRGVFAGIEVDTDSDFSNIFSKNKTIRLNEGLNLTNGDQAGQFLIDAIATGIVAFNVIFRDHYCKFAGEVINECYKNQLIDLLRLVKRTNEKILDEDRDDKDKLCKDLVKYREEMNRLYEHLKEDLKPYGAEPIFSTTLVDIPNMQDEWSDTESQS